MSEAEILGAEALKRREIRRMCKAYPDGLYFFTKAVCGFDKLSPSLHRPFTNYVQLHQWNGGPPRSNRKLAWMPREHFKSTICSIAFPLWLLSCVDWNMTIALISADSDNTKKWLRAAKEIIKYNGFFRWAFPEIRPGDKWDEEEVAIRRDRQYGSDVQASITAYSINSGLASQHHGYIILDDPVNEQVAGSVAMMADAVRLYIHLEEILRGWKDSGYLIVDTPWGREDPHHAALQEVRRGYRLKWGIGVLGEFEISDALRDRPELIPALELGKPILPGECDEDKLTHIKAQDIEKFYFHYLCKPYEAGRNGFNLELIRDFALFPDGRMDCQCHPTHYHHLSQGSTVAASDPAYTVDKKSCESSIGVANKQPCGCRFMLHEWGGHVTPPDFLSKSAEIASAWKTWLKGFGVESEALQVTLKDWLLEKQSQGTFPLGIDILELKPKKRNKDGRISAQQGAVNEGLWHKRPTMQRVEGVESWLQQLFQWPWSRKRDRADMWAYLEDAWAQKPAALAATTSRAPNVNLRRQEADMELFRQEAALA